MSFDHNWSYTLPQPDIAPRTSHSADVWFSFMTDLWLIIATLNMTKFTKLGKGLDSTGEAVDWSFPQKQRMAQVVQSTTGTKTRHWETAKVSLFTSRTVGPHWYKFLHKIRNGHPYSFCSSLLYKSITYTRKPGYDKPSKRSEGTNSGASSPVLRRALPYCKSHTTAHELLKPKEHRNSCPSHSTCTAQSGADQQFPVILRLHVSSVRILHIQANYSHHESSCTQKPTEFPSCADSKTIKLVTLANPSLEHLKKLQ